MPTSQYQCDACGELLEIVQSFTDDALTVCPSCQAPDLRKVYGSVGVVFKGSGFYRTDSRTSSEASKTAAEKSTTTTPAPDKAAPAKATPASTPAPAKSAATPTKSPSTPAK